MTAEIQVNRLQLLEAAKAAARLAPTLPAMPILAMARITVGKGNHRGSGNTLRVEATNLETTLIAETIALGPAWSLCVPAWSLCVPAKLLARVLAACSGPDVALVPGDGRLIVRVGRTEYRLISYSADDFPTLAVGQEGQGDANQDDADVAQQIAVAQRLVGLADVSGTAPTFARGVWVGRKVVQVIAPKVIARVVWGDVAEAGNPTLIAPPTLRAIATPPEAGPLHMQVGPDTVVFSRVDGGMTTRIVGRVDKEAAAELTGARDALARILITPDLDRRVDRLALRSALHLAGRRSVSVFPTDNGIQCNWIGEYGEGSIEIPTNGIIPPFRICAPAGAKMLGVMTGDNVAIAVGKGDADRPGVIRFDCMGTGADGAGFRETTTCAHAPESR